MDRYEFTEGGSAKFWEAGVECATLRVRFGRVGTQGQAKDKVFADAAAADAALKKLVREKTGKGYAPVGSAEPAAAGPAPVPAPPEAAPSAHPPTTPSTPPPAPKPAAAPPAGVVAVPRPSGGRKRLTAARPLPTRSRPGPPMRPDEAWAELRRLVEAGERPTGPDGITAAAFLDALLGAPPPASMSALEARAFCNALIGAHVYEATRWRPFAEVETRVAMARKMELFAHWLVGSGGALLAVQAANVLRPPAPRQPNASDDSDWCMAHSLGLRAAIVGAAEADYDGAVALCLAICEREPDDLRLRAFFAFILADDRPGAHALRPLPVLEEAQRRGVEVSAQRCLHPLIAEAPPAAAAPWRSRRADLFHFVSFEVEAERLAATVAAAARRHGEPAAEPLAWLLAQAGHGDQTAVALAMLDTREEDALGLLLPVLHEKGVRPALDRAAALDPAWTLGRCLALMAAGSVDATLRARALDAVGRHGVETVRVWAAEAGPRASAQLDRLLGSRTAAAAPPEDWPAVLRDPPWRRAKRAVSDDIVLDLAPIPTPFADRTPAKAGPEDTYRTNRGLVLKAMTDLPDVIADVEAKPQDYWRRVPPPHAPLPGRGTPEAEVLAWLAKRLADIGRNTRYGLRYGTYEHVYGGLERQPDALALMMWELTGPLLDANVHWPDTAPLMLQRFGERALRGAVGIVMSDPILGFEHFAAVDAAEIAPPAARALLLLKKARPLAVAWLRRHRRTALLRLIPDAVGRPGPARDAAEHALRWLADDAPDGREALDAAVGDYAAAEPRVRDAVAQVMARSALDRVPSKVANLPGWLNPAALSPPLLRTTGGALPPAAVAPVCEMLSFSTPDAVYGGVDVLKQSCTPASLGAFSWDLFAAWLAAGAPAKDGWAFRALGWLGDDEAARRLTPLVRRWPGESAHARAVTGLDVLADIGSDVALVGLNGIAEKLKFKGLQDRAREKIAAVAEARELTPDELADRLAPDLGLDTRGGLDLDFGPRRFRAGFDELLRPVVKDENGKRLKDLPKPTRADDAERAAAAVALWSTLKKDARAVAGLQLVRLEAMLATGRRVKPDAFGAFFAGHPLLRNLASRLVWGVYADAAPGRAPTLTFRVTEEGDFADAGDAPVSLDLGPEAAGLVGLVHPLQVGPGGLEPWGALFGDYEIAQPFPQLGREVFALTEAEKALRSLDRFDGVEVGTARLRGMAAQGWPQGAPQDGGVVGWLERPVAFADGSAGLATLDLGEGLFTGASQHEPKRQKLGELGLVAPSSYGAAGRAGTFGELDPLAASEMLRGVALLVAASAA